MTVPTFPHRAETVPPADTAPVPASGPVADSDSDLLLIALWQANPWDSLADTATVGPSPAAVEAAYARVEHDLQRELAADHVLGRAGHVVAVIGRGRAVDQAVRRDVAAWLARRDDLFRVDVAGPMSARRLDWHLLRVHTQATALALYLGLGTVLALDDVAATPEPVVTHLRRLLRSGLLDDAAPSATPHAAWTVDAVVLDALVERAMTQAAMALQVARLRRDHLRGRGEGSDVRSG